MSELKQKILLYELAKIGFRDAEYIPEFKKPDGITEPDKIVLDPQDSRMPQINNAGDISYAPVYDYLAVNTLRPLVDKVNEMYGEWERSSGMPFEDLKQFRLLSEYNNIMLAARDDTEFGRGLHFVTWQYDYDRTGLEHGHYTEDFAAAKEDFAIRAGLIPKEKIVTQEQAVEIITIINNLIENDYDLYLTYSKEAMLNEIVEKLRSAYLEKEPQANIEREAETQHDSNVISVSAKENHNILENLTFQGQLNNKLNAEYERFIEDLKSLPPDKIVEKSYEKVFKEDLIVTIEEKNLDDEEAKALLDLDNPLEELYQEWLDTDVSYMDMLRDCVDSKISRIIEYPDEHERKYEVEPNDKFAELSERITQNYNSYNNSLDKFSKSELIEMSAKIAAVSEVYEYLSAWEDMSDDKLNFLLQFKDPLEVVSNALYEFKIDRNAETADVIYELTTNPQDRLVDYPLVGDDEPPADPSLRRYMDIDLELYLGKIAEKVIIHYPDDFKIDMEAFHRAAASDNPDDKRLMWHVCSYGTHLNTERETFIKDTGAFNTWVDYRPRDEDMFGYVVEVTGYDGGIIKGNVFEVGDYYSHSLYVKDSALLLDSVTLTYSDDWGVNAGKTISVAKFEYDEQRNSLMSESGNVTAITYHPWEAMRKMSDLMRQERARRMSLPIGSTGELLRKMADKLSEIRRPPEKAKHIAEKPKPKTLEEKLNAAKEKVKMQDKHINDKKFNKREDEINL